jgi:hypothetical protein
MKKGIFTAILMVIVITQTMFSACRKSESERARVAPEAHQQAMVKKSFAESKKVAAAKVNGETITMFALLREMNAVAPRYAAAGREKTPELDGKIRAAALNTLIVQELAVQEARKRGLQVKPDVIDREIQNIQAKTGPGNAFQAYLAENGLTEAELRKTIEQDALFEMIAGQEVDQKITVTDAALKARYKKEKAGLTDASHRSMTFEESKGVLEQQLRAEAGEKRMREWEAQLKKGARIEILGQKQKQG